MTLNQDNCNSNVNSTIFGNVTNVQIVANIELIYFYFFLGMLLLGFFFSLNV